MQYLNPDISIILPMFNGDKYIHKCIQSVLSQTFKNFELICVDDGSIDETLLIVEDYQLKDRRIKVFSQKNQGPGVARNNGINAAKGEFLTFIDQDDFVSLYWLEKMINNIRKNNADISYCYAASYIEKDGTEEFVNCKYPRFISNSFELTEDMRSLLSTNFFPPWSKLVRRVFLQENFISFATNNIKFDDVYYNALIVNFSKTVCFVNDILYFHREHDESITGESKNKKNNRYFDHVRTLELLALFGYERNLQDPNCIANRMIVFTFSYAKNVNNDFLYIKEIERVCFKYNLNFKYFFEQRRRYLWRAFFKLRWDFLIKFFHDIF